MICHPSRSIHVSKKGCRSRVQHSLPTYTVVAPLMEGSRPPTKTVGDMHQILVSAKKTPLFVFRSFYHLPVLESLKQPHPKEQERHIYGKRHKRENHKQHVSFGVGLRNCSLEVSQNQPDMQIFTLPKTNRSSLKMDGWDTVVLSFWEPAPFNSS